MWKYMGWPLAAAVALYTYITLAQGRAREAALHVELADSQQLALQVSNRLAVIEAQFNTYKSSQERDGRDCLPPAKDTAIDKRRPATSPRVPEREAESKPSVTHSISTGISTFMTRLRGGLSKPNNNPPPKDN